MLDTIHMIGHMPSEDVMKRLIQAGLELQFYPAACAEMAAENIRTGVVKGSTTLMLGIDPVPPPFLAWADVAPQQAHLGANGQIPTTEQIMQAVVQYNRQQVLAGAPSAAAGAAAALQAHAGASEQQEQQQQPFLVVGYVMKSSREDALAKAGMLHVLPQQGMCCMPVDLDTLQQHSSAQQQQQEMHIDILLLKGSDELVPLSESSTAAAAAGGAEGDVGPAAVGVRWSPRLMALQSWLNQHPSVCVVDPFKNTAKVLDRYLLARLLHQLQEVPLTGEVKARGPAFWEAASFDTALAAAVTTAGLQPPYIVKPRVACGVSHSHSMALVLSTAGLQQLQDQLPTPALVQEFVNHGGQQYKVYVMGEQVFVTPRASIPDIHLDNAAWQQQQQQYLLFDSLASLPTQLPPELTSQQQQGSSAAGASPPGDAVRAIAAFLRQHLGLTLFGFDVVVAQRSSRQQQQQQQGQQQEGQELVVIDVNYFPNYRGGSDVPAMFRNALRQAWEQHQQLLKVDGM